MIDHMESVTAKLCSFARARHSNLERNKIFDDYLAYDLMGLEEYEQIGQLIEHDYREERFDPALAFSGPRICQQLNRYISPIPLSRAAFAERELSRFARKRGRVQYVICGAGMDTFAFRNGNPDIEIFELDHPDTQRYKLERIRKLEWNIPANVHYVPVDFSRDDMALALRQAGYDPAAPAFFSILGVTYYLTLSVFAQTLRRIGELCARGSMVVFDFPDDTTFRKTAPERVRTLTGITASLGEPMRHGYSVAEVDAALERGGFRIDEHASPARIQRRFFDGRTDGQRAYENIHFILAKKEANPLNTTIFTSESVTKGHPDKVCDIISDSILDAYLAKDPNARVAAETVVKNNTVILVGEISSSADVDAAQVARDAIRSIGYDRDELGFNADTAEIISRLDRQSPDIARGVDRALETRDTDENDIGAGDQGMMFGYATDETGEYMPLALSLAHALARRLTEVRENGTLPYLRPDGKTQVSVRYEGSRPAGIDTVLISTQHDPDVSLEQIRADLIRLVVKPVIPAKWLDGNVRILVNPTGRFVIGGPVGDSGLTGRKIIVDTYGGAARHGGGAFSGKDPTKVDRSAAYCARYIAKNIVAAGLAKRAEIQLAYAIGVARPVSVNVNTFGTGRVSDARLLEAVNRLVDLRPAAIIERFGLRRPIYAQTAAYGHFGRTDAALPWEQTDLAPQLAGYFERRESA